MNRKALVRYYAAAVFTLGAVLIACSGTSGQECRDGSTKIEVNHGKRSTYYCRDGRWVKG